MQDKREEGSRVRREHAGQSLQQRLQTIMPELTDQIERITRLHVQTLLGRIK